MRRSEAIQYMVGLGLRKSTARDKTQDAIRKPGQPVQVRSSITVKAVRRPGGSGGPDIIWDFVFDDTRR